MTYAPRTLFGTVWRTVTALLSGLVFVGIGAGVGAVLMRYGIHDEQGKILSGAVFCSTSPFIGVCKWALRGRLAYAAGAFLAAFLAAFCGARAVDRGREVLHPELGRYGPETLMRYSVLVPLAAMAVFFVVWRRQRPPQPEPDEEREAAEAAEQEAAQKARPAGAGRVGRPAHKPPAFLTAMCSLPTIQTRLRASVNAARCPDPRERRDERALPAPCGDPVAAAPTCRFRRARRRMG